MTDDRARRLADAKLMLSQALRILDDLGEDHAAVRVQHALEVVGQGRARRVLDDQGSSSGPLN